jgi:septal ring factor EnvC (AmiA/AmiB activator)
MGTRMNKETYCKLVSENLVWLMKQPFTLERDHIESIVKDSINTYYDKRNAHTHQLNELKDQLSEKDKEIDYLKKEVQRLSKCSCGRNLSIGCCSICDNDQ